MNHLYTVQEIDGMWVIIQRVPVKECLIKSVAETYVAAWNEGRQPTVEELSQALSQPVQEVPV